jgi:hypothetical protein
MKLYCGSTVYGTGKEIGCLSGFVVDAAQDRVVAVLIQPRHEHGDCLKLPFQHVESSSEAMLESSAAASSLERLSEETCQADQLRLHQWLENLTEEDFLQSGAGTRFAVISDEDRGTINLPAGQALSISECGCGAIAYVAVDRQGYINEVGVHQSKDGGAEIAMYPIAKRTRSQLVSSARTVLSLV